MAMPARAAGPPATTSSIRQRPGTADSATVTPSQPLPGTAAVGFRAAGSGTADCAAGCVGGATGKAIGSPIEMSAGVNAVGGCSSAAVAV